VHGYVLAKLGGGVLDRGTVGDSIGRGLGLLWAPTAESLPPNHSVEFRLETAREAARREGKLVLIDLFNPG